MSEKLFSTFKELDEKRLAVDLHLHSTWSDGEGDIKQIIVQAEKYHLHTIAFTDHLRKSSTYFFDAKREIAERQSETAVKLLSGFEAKIEDFFGTLDVAPEVLEAADISIISVHRFPVGRKLYAAKHFSYEIASAIELELSVAALHKGGFDVLGHPGGMCLAQFGKFPQEYFEEIIRLCAEKRIAFDLNGRYHKNNLSEIIPLLFKYNPLICIGSDGHRLEEIGAWSYYLQRNLQSVKA